MQENDEAQAQRDGWDAGEIAEQSSYGMEDEIKREVSRGDETKGDPDARDVVGGASPSIDTWQGREEAKTRTEGGTS